MTSVEEADARLIQALDAARHRAKILLEHGEQQMRSGVWLAQPADNWTDAVCGTLLALQEHPEFGQGVNFAFGPKQTVLHPTMLSSNALQHAASHGGVETVAWLRRLFNFQGPTTLRHAAEVFGLRVDDKVVLSNGVTLVPLEELPTSNNAFAVQAAHFIRPGANFSHEPSIGVYIERNNITRTGQPTGECRSIILERTIRAFTLIDKMAPVVGTSWVDHTDPDLFVADLGRIWMGGWMEGRHPMFAELVDAAAIEWVERYLALPESVRDRLDLAITRLNLGRRRLYPGDQAIEAGICLEALLGGRGEKADMTYKLRLRTARLLERSYEARRDILKAVNELYALRSKTVHGDVDAEDRAGTAIARTGLEISARVLQATVLNGALFDTVEIDLNDESPVSPSKER